tara:strand:+ start:877 stop:1074 length:198 start_codon:yes stop_codon:yes gene_type:complete
VKVGDLVELPMSKLMGLIIEYKDCEHFQWKVHWFHDDGGATGWMMREAIRHVKVKKALDIKKRIN